MKRRIVPGGAVTYLDSSAFVKVVVEEPESVALRVYLSRHASRVVSSALLRVETLRAVRHLGPELLAVTREALRGVDLVAFDDRLLEVAAVLEPRVLRALDAIHLATALAVGDNLDSIVIYDDRILEGARLLGLPTASPAR